MFFKKINIDISHVIELASTKPFGFTKFLPGPGVWRTLHTYRSIYLYWLGKKNGFNLKFVKSSGEINEKITSWIVQQMVNFFKRNKIKIPSKKILILGIAYKKDIDDLRRVSCA